MTVGDTIGTFSVTDIKKDRIILADGANKHEILLYDKNKPARQVTAAEKAAAPTVVASGPTAAAAAARTGCATGCGRPSNRLPGQRTGKARRRLNIKSSTHLLDRPSKGYNNPYETKPLPSFFARSSSASLFLSVARDRQRRPRQTRIDDRTGKAEVEAAEVAGAAEKPGTGTAAAARR